MTKEQTVLLISAAIAFVLGAIVGDLYGVAVYRLPAGISLRLKPHCPFCKNKLKFYHSIPVVSYILLGGRCRFCGEKIPVKYFLLELVNGTLWLLFALAAPRFNYAYSVTCALALSACVAAAFVDYEHGIIPDSLVAEIAVIGVIACFLDKNYILWQSRVFGFLFGFLFYGFFWAVTKFLIKKEGLGFGDVKFMAAIGLVTGVKAAFFACLLSSVCAAVVLSVKSAVKKEKSVEYAFAPFLTTGVIIAAFVGESAVNAYLGLFAG